VLRRWAIDDPAPTSPEATLRVDARGVSGRAGCNSYSGEIGQIAAPGDIRFGPFVTTRMMCPDSAMQVESRFLAALGDAVKVGFLTGRLAISYLRPDGSLGTLLFDRRRLEN
jgi:heat shock protein HslJ